MILSDKMILDAMAAGDIEIEPFDRDCLGSNSYDVHLGPILATYERKSIDGYSMLSHEPLDCRRPSTILRTAIPDYGAILMPGRLYLGSTFEFTRTRRYVPFLDGKSSIGRLGITIHCTAGRGDVGFANHWTLEIHVVEPVRVYVDMPIGQLIYFETGDVLVPYDAKPSAKYNERSAEPQASQMWRNFK